MSDRPGFVYAVRVGPLVKIGFSRSIEQRYRTHRHLLKKYYNKPVSFLGCVKGTPMDEQIAHKHATPVVGREMFKMASFPGLQQLFPSRKVMKLNDFKKRGFGVKYVRLYLPERLLASLEKEAVVCGLTIARYIEEILMERKRPAKKEEGK